MEYFYFFSILTIWLPEMKYGLSCALNVLLRYYLSFMLDSVCGSSW